MNFNHDLVAKEIAQKLLEVKAIALSPEKPFQWSSGWNSPIYCDNRVALSFPSIRSYIKQALADLIKSEFPEAEAIAGVATAGIPQGALVADLLDLPFAYVRPEPKKHGMGNQIEGHLEKGAKVVMLEDLISTGGSSLKAAKALQENEIEVVGTVAIFSYGFEVASESFSNAGIPLKVLSNYSTLLEIASEKGYVSKEQVGVLNQWRISPDTWGK